MKQLPNDLYQKIETLNKDVKEQLKLQGIIVPVKGNNGSIKIGHYTILRNNLGVYSILNINNNTVVDNINLPQTAALIANRLALGKWVDDELIKVDQKYGHAEFDELLHTHLAEKNAKSKNYDRAELMIMKSSVARYRKDQHKKSITRSFDKLLKFR